MERSKTLPRNEEILTTQTNFTANNIDAQTVIRLFSSINIPATVNAKGSVTGKLTNPRISIDLNTDNAMYEFLNFGRATGNLLIDNENLKLIGGIMDNEILDQAAVQNVANLPTLDEARANIVGILNASASKLISILLARSEKMSSLSPENSEK